MTPILSIIIPQYKTLELTRLCIRAIKQFSILHPEIIVVDNNSKDASLDYLKKIKNITLIENKRECNGADAHRLALDLGIKKARGQWILLFHSDSIVLRKGWDEDLIDLTKKYPGTIGATTIYRDINRFAPWYTKLLRYFKERNSFFNYTFNPTDKKIMSYCFLIERQFFLKTGYEFYGSQGDVGDSLYQIHIKNKKPFILLGRKMLNRFIWHTSNATSLAAGLMNDKKSKQKFFKKRNQLLSSDIISSILKNNALDKS
jgi:glycosyltransferase involved in cell wall biosynthesis